MKGSIRFFVGLLVAFGAAGGLDNAADNQLLPLAATAVLGLALMASGAAAFRKV